MEIEEIEKLSEEQLNKICDVSYTKDNKSRNFKIITYPKKEDYKMSEEQIQHIARFLCHNISDVHRYIEDNEENYKKWIEEKNDKY